MSDFRVSVTIDSVADAAYIALSSEPIDTTCELTSDVLVDVDAMGMVVGIETLRLDADIPIGLLIDRFHVKADVAELLLAAERSAGSLHLSQGHDGYAAESLILA